jgi:COMMD2-7/10, HN domain
MELSDLKACIAVLNFVFSNAAKYDAEVGVISDELQQLGLPKGWWCFSSLCAFRSECKSV